MDDLGQLRIREIRLKPGYEWSAASDHWWFLQIAEGESYWIGQPQNKSLIIGEVIATSPSTAGIIRASQLSEVTIRGFFFEPESLLGFFTLAECDLFRLRKAQRVGNVKFFPPSHPVCRMLAALKPSESPQNSFSQRAEALRIVAAVVERKHLTSQRSNAEHTPCSRRFNRLVSQVTELELLNVSNRELALQCGCSLRYFNHLFWRQFHVSLREFRIRLRLRKACHLLRTTDNDPAAVAVECGFPTTKALGIVFRSRLGISPAEFRNAARGSSGFVMQVGRGGTFDLDGGEPEGSGGVTWM